MATVVNTDLDAMCLVNDIRAAEAIGFDTESVGPELLSGKMINVFKSDMVGFSVAFPNGGSVYVPMRHSTDNCDIDEARNVLHAVATHPAVWAHNWKHDLHVLEIEDGIAVENPLDSMVLMWLLAREAGPGGRYGLKALTKTFLGREPQSFEEAFQGKPINDLSPYDVADYACADARGALELGLKFSRELKEQGLWTHFTEIEMPFVRTLLLMEQAGMGINPTKLLALQETLKHTTEELREEWSMLFPSVSIASGKQLQQLIAKDEDHVSNDRPWNGAILERTSTGLYKTDKEALQALVEWHDPGSMGHEAARIRLDFQHAAKFLSTYTSSLISEASQYPDLRIHSSYHHTGTATGRLSSSGPNLQNIPARSELGKKIKSCFVPAHGGVLVACDYSQIEPRLLAHFAGGPLAAIYADGQDIYQETADAVGVSRSDAKTIILATMYGVGPGKIAKKLKCTPDEASSFLNKFYLRFPEVKALKQKIISAVERKGFVKTLDGRRRPIPEINQQKAIRWRGERLAVNTPIQGGAADIVKRAMLALDKGIAERGIPARIISQVHDEVTLEVFPTEEWTPEKVAAWQKKTMESVVKLRVPLVAEVKVGNNWAECK